MWSKTHKSLPLPSDQKPLRGQFIWLIGGNDLGKHRSILDSMLKQQGAKTKWTLYLKKGKDETDSVVELVEQFAKASLCIVHLGMDHSNSGKILKALELIEKPYFVLPSYHGSTEILQKVETHFGRLSND